MRRFDPCIQLELLSFMMRMQSVRMPWVSVTFAFPISSCHRFRLVMDPLPVIEAVEDMLRELEERELRVGDKRVMQSAWERPKRLRHSSGMPYAFLFVTA